MAPDRLKAGAARQGGRERKKAITLQCREIHDLRLLLPGHRGALEVCCNILFSWGWGNVVVSIKRQYNVSLIGIKSGISTLTDSQALSRRFRLTAKVIGLVIYYAP